MARASSRTPPRAALLSGRRRSARRGSGASCLLPAVFGDETLAVCEFLATEPPVTTQRLIRVLSGMGHEVGHFLSHRRGELSAPGDSREHFATRERAAILLASASDDGAADAAMWMTDESHVRKVIHEFNERGMRLVDPELPGRASPPDHRRAAPLGSSRWPVPVPTAGDRR